MLSQKTSAWYRHLPWYRQPIVPALIPCSSGAWRFRLVPNNARHKNKEVRNYAGFRAFYAISCQTLSDAASFPRNRRCRLAVDVIRHTVNDAHVVDDATRSTLEQRVRQFSQVRRHEDGHLYSAHGNHVLV